MTKQSLYILGFKDEAVIKVGLAVDRSCLALLLEPELSWDNSRKSLAVARPRL